MTAFQTVVPTKQRALDATGVDYPAIAVHGSLYLSPYIIGTSRGDQRNNLGQTYDYRCQIVWLHEDDYSDYRSISVPAPSGALSQYVRELADVCFAAGSIWTWGSYWQSNGSPKGRVVQINPATRVVAATWDINHFSSKCETVRSDGTYLYLTGGQFMHKWDIASQTRVAFSDITDSAAYSGVTKPSNMGSGLHSSVLSTNGQHLLVSNSSLTSSNKWLFKVRTSDMKVIGYVQIPQVTDDMATDGTYVYLGVEEPLSTAYGYDWGAMAVRISDLAVFPLPKLGASDTSTTVSYASLFFQTVDGPRLADTKTNRHQYIIDASNPSSWSTSMSGTQLSNIVLHDATLSYSIPGLGASSTPNELVVDDYGRLHSFVWDPDSPYISGAIRYQIAGVTLSTPPAVTTLASTDEDLDARSLTLNGDLTSSGGSTLTAKGFIVGTTNPPTTKHVASGTSTGPYSLNLTGLPAATVYYRAYATNALGDGLGAIRSIDFGSGTGTPSITGSITRDGQAVSGAKVFAIGVSTGQVEATATSNAEGVYAFYNLPSGTYHLTCEHVAGSLVYAGQSKPRRVV